MNGEKTIWHLDKVRTAIDTVELRPDEEEEDEATVAVAEEHLFPFVSATSSVLFPFGLRRFDQIRTIE
jgi:hypothetical protein